MSIPSWFPPPRGPNGDVTGPLTGRMIVVEPQPLTVVVPGAGAATGVVPGLPVVPTPVLPPTVPDIPASPCAASRVPACSTLCCTCACAAAGMFEPPTAAPVATPCVCPGNSEPQVARPTIPSTSSPFVSCQLRTAASV